MKNIGKRNEVGMNCLGRQITAKADFVAVGEEAFRTRKERTNDSSEVWACRTIGRPHIVLSRETRLRE